MKLRCLIVSLLCFVSLRLMAQEELTLKLRQFEQETETPPPLRDSTFLALKEAYNKAIEQKNMVAAATCLQQMGQTCYHLGHYPQALDYHLQAAELFRAEGKRSCWRIT